jgi:hypothetical protein
VNSSNFNNIDSISVEPPNIQKINETEQKKTVKNIQIFPPNCSIPSESHGTSFSAPEEDGVFLSFKAGSNLKLNLCSNNLSVNYFQLFAPQLLGKLLDQYIRALISVAWKTKTAENSIKIPSASASPSESNKLQQKKNSISISSNFSNKSENDTQNSIDNIFRLYYKDDEEHEEKSTQEITLQYLTGIFFYNDDNI